MLVVAAAMRNLPGEKKEIRDPLSPQKRKKAASYQAHSMRQSVHPAERELPPECGDAFRTR